MEEEIKKSIQIFKGKKQNLIEILNNENSINKNNIVIIKNIKEIDNILEEYYEKLQNSK